MAVTPRLRTAALVLVIGACCATDPRAQDRPANPAAGDERLAAARGQLRTLLGDAGADGRIAERSRGNYFFSPSRGDLPDAIIRNTAAVGALAVGPRLRIWGTLDDAGGLTVRRYTLAAAADRPTESAESALLPDAVRTASDQIVANLNDALRPGTMSVTDRTLNGPSVQSQSIKDDFAKIRSAYRQAVDSGADPRLITAIVRKYADARRQVADAFTESDEHKALYRSAENYDPFRYDVIFRQARAAVAIGEPGDATARCSGVLIAADLVLTAAHCFGGRNPKTPQELEVWFGYSRLPIGSLPPLERRPVVALVAPAANLLPKMIAGEFSSQLLDYAILRFDRNANQPATAQDPVPQCLRSRALVKGDPVYVVGYPEGAPQMVHDSARVYLPFEIMDGDNFLRLRLDVEADLLDSPAAARAEFMKQFDSSYTTTEQRSGVTYRYFYHVKHGNQPHMGIVANTFKGDSGGPVFERVRSQCVVGILVSGADDTGERINVSWERHEAVLPITAILKDAERFVPTIRTQLKLE